MNILSSTLAFFAVVLIGSSHAQTTATSPERAAVEANDRAYEAAYARSDVKALANFFAEDADYTTEEGRVISSREAIGAAIKEGLMANRGSKVTIATDSVRVLAADTVLQKGTSTVTTNSGEVSSALFTAIHVRKDGQWKISQLIESPAPVLTPADRLAELSWLLGEWEESDRSNDLTIRSQYAWARGGNFLTRSITVRRAGNVTLEGWQVIGWDPIAGQLRSWTFDGEGGFAEGYFTRDGNRWLLREKGIAPDGSRTTADNTITKVSADKLTWESNNRTLDGDPQPGIGRVEITRVKAN